MSMIDWAERECKLACKRENPNFNWDDKNDFDYGCNCYKSAFKAYKSLCKDGHSGFNFSMTKKILERLMESQPLTPITDDDFFINIDKEMYNKMSEFDEYCKIRGIKSSIQCPRKSSLFREESLDGEVSYHDNDRYYYIDVENPSDTYHSSAKFLDKMFPITMPYVPEKNKYKIFAQTFLTDQKNGDFDTRGILYMITPSGEKIDINIYQTEKDGKFVDISKEEYNELLKKRIDKLNKKVASSLMWTLISNSGSEEEIALKEELFKGLDETIKEGYYNQLEELCLFFDNPEHYKYNTFFIKQVLCEKRNDIYGDIPELVNIANFLDSILKDLYARKS